MSKQIGFIAYKVKQKCNLKDNYGQDSQNYRNLNLNKYIAVKTVEY